MSELNLVDPLALEDLFASRVPQSESINAAFTDGASPEMLKFAYATWCSQTEPHAGRMRRLERLWQAGPLGMVKDIDHWAIEEFLWHGLPGERMHPLDAWLQAGTPGPRGRPISLSPRDRARVARWKDARFGIFEIGPVDEPLVELREWDSGRQRPVGEWMRCFDLSIGGVKRLRPHRGELYCTYLVPWEPEKRLYCCPGYALISPARNLGTMALLQGIQDPAALARPLPWSGDRRKRREWLRTWTARHWSAWFQANLTLPFRALVQMPGSDAFVPVDVLKVMDTPARLERRYGTYLIVRFDDGSDEGGLIGASNIIPLETGSPAFLAFLEYSEFRRLAGPPPEKPPHME